MRASAFVFSAVMTVTAMISNVADATDTLRVRLDWSPWGDQVPFHLAVKKGWYAKQGLNVQLEDGNGSVSTVQIVGNGDYDLGHASLATMAIARSKGLQVKAVAGFIRQNDIGLMIGKDTGVNSPKDLKGKKLTFTAGSLETPFLDRFISAGGLTRDDLELTNVDAANKGTLYMSGRVDGAFSSAPFMQPIFDRQRPTKTIKFSDYGLEFPSFGLFATEATIAAKRDQIRKFASVTAGAWQYILNGHEAEGVQAIMEARPQAKLDAQVLLDQIKILRGLVSTPATAGKPMGIMAEADWAKAIDTLQQGKLMGHVEAPGAYYTNEFIDEKLVKEIADGGN
ncbi:ABC transporter substrate-binding protein [Bradyrhizobium erythrophlei]|uniref:Thiamine pyrimidine synthase n=1 Tax=Bradyrhizobium erythrophlei TaxID=1437360 RepID=A0A1M5QWR8_9BRAD|nr:ABC transporter substrate-binding protein [Bradyrhizobium erythrophlei]SHH18575.1 NitT/TauT family transport system substrate-binding protein [Bradyrhizobium erythrophlei]